MQVYIISYVFGYATYRIFKAYLSKKKATEEFLRFKETETELDKLVSPYYCLESEAAEQFINDKGGWEIWDKCPMDTKYEEMNEMIDRVRKKFLDENLSSKSKETVQVLKPDFDPYNGELEIYFKLEEVELDEPGNNC